MLGATELLREMTAPSPKPCHENDTDLNRYITIMNENTLERVLVYLVYHPIFQNCSGHVSLQAWRRSRCFKGVQRIFAEFWFETCAFYKSG